VEAVGADRAFLFDVAADPTEATDLSMLRAEEKGRLAAETAIIGGVSDPSRLLDARQADTVRSLGYADLAPKGAPILPASLVSAGNEALQGERSYQRRLMQAAAFVFQDVLRQDPENYLALTVFGSMNLGARNGPQADALLKRAQARYPADGEVYHLLGHLTLATARDAGDVEKARRLFELAVQLDPLNEEALYDAACSLAALDPAAALGYLDAAVKNGFRDFEHMSKDTDLDPIRGQARFQAITMGRASAAPRPPGPPAPDVGKPPAGAPAP